MEFITFQRNAVINTGSRVITIMSKNTKFAMVDMYQNFTTRQLELPADFTSVTHYKTFANDDWIAVAIYIKTDESDASEHDSGDDVSEHGSGDDSASSPHWILAYDNDNKCYIIPDTSGEDFEVEHIYFDKSRIYIIYQAINFSDIFVEIYDTNTSILLRSRTVTTMNIDNCIAHVYNNQLYLMDIDQEWAVLWFIDINDYKARITPSGIYTCIPNLYELSGNAPLYFAFAKSQLLIFVPKKIISVNLQDFTINRILQCDKVYDIVDRGVRPYIDYNYDESQMYMIAFTSKKMIVYDIVNNKTIADVAFPSTRKSQYVIYGNFVLVESADIKNLDYISHLSKTRRSGSHTKMAIRTPAE